MPRSFAATLRRTTRMMRPRAPTPARGRKPKRVAPLSAPVRSGHAISKRETERACLCLGTAICSAAPTV
jgi:hypothetical protein